MQARCVVFPPSPPSPPSPFPYLNNAVLSLNDINGVTRSVIRYHKIQKKHHTLTITTKRSILFNKHWLRSACSPSPFPLLSQALDAKIEDKHEWPLIKNWEQNDPHITRNPQIWSPISPKALRNTERISRFSIEFLARWILARISYLILLSNPKK